MGLVNLKPLFRPQNAIAVVGVSTTNWMNPGTVVWRKNYFMPGTKHNVYGVNPKGGIIDGQPLFETLEDIPERLDLVVGAVRADLTPDIVEQAGKLGVPAMIIVSGGFSEVGGDGVFLQEEMARLAFQYDIALVGPNCVGIAAPPYVDTFFIPSERYMPALWREYCAGKRIGGHLGRPVFHQVRPAGHRYCFASFHRQQGGH